MSVPGLIFPVLVQVGLTFVLLFCTGRSRAAAVNAGQVKIRDAALGQRVWPEQATKFANAYHNQFELPVLFYVLTGLLLITSSHQVHDVVLSWCFVLSRLAHAFIHVTSNRVSHRFGAFIVGVGVLIFMWILFAIRLFSSGVV